MQTVSSLSLVVYANCPLCVCVCVREDRVGECISVSVEVSLENTWLRLFFFIMQLPKCSIDVVVNLDQDNLINVD